jgi:hypothetical protein
MLFFEGKIWQETSEQVLCAKANHARALHGNAVHFSPLGLANIVHTKGWIQIPFSNNINIS